MKRFLAIAIGVGAYVALAVSASKSEPISVEESVPTPTNDSATKQSGDALALFKARDYEGALKLWQETVRDKPDMPPAQVIMAQLFMQVGMFKEAKDALDHAVVDAPNDPEPYLLLAGIALRDRAPEKAESQYQKAKGLLVDFKKSETREKWLQLQLFGGLSALAESRDDWAAAQKAAEESLKVEPKNVAAMQQIAFYLVKQKKPEAALARLRDAAKQDKTMPLPEVLLAQLYQRTGETENVKKWMAAAIAAEPKNLKVRIAAAYCALGMSQLEDAQKHALAASQIDPKSFDAKFLRGLIALLQKDYVAGELYFDSALKQTPNDFSAANNLALALVEQGDEAKTRRALELAEANAKKFANSASAISTYGWALYKAGKLDEADQALKKSLALSKPSIDTAYYAAKVLADRGRAVEARQLLETALKGNTSLSMCRAEAEELLAQLKNKDK